MNRARSIIEEFKGITGKFPSMRNAQHWVVYPHNPSTNEVVIQCETRIAKVNLDTGKAVLSANGKTLFVGLDPRTGATVVDTPKDMLDQLKKMKPFSSSQQKVVGESSISEDSLDDFLKKLSSATGASIISRKGNLVVIQAEDDDSQSLLDMNLKGRASRGRKILNNKYEWIFKTSNEASDYDIESLADYLANDSEDSDSPQKELVSMGLNKKQADALVSSWFKLDPKQRLKLSLSNKEFFPWIKGILG
jgi:hypothetical protein